MGTDNKPTTTVDPNTEPSKDLENHAQEDFGAKEEMDHPLTQSTVDPNYEPKNDAPGFPSGEGRRSRSSTTESDDVAGVTGGGGKYTDDE